MSDQNCNVSQLTYKPTESLLNVINNNISKTNSTPIPEIVYANDGSKFFPCKFCCLAFAYKQDQIKHMQGCNFKEDGPQPIEDVPKPKARKSFGNTSLTHVRQLRKLQKPLKPYPNIKNEPIHLELDSAPLPGDVKQLSLMFPKTCIECGEVFSSKTAMHEHKKEKHPKIYVSTEDLIHYDALFKQSDMNQCTICFKPTIKPQWARHLATHAEEKNFDCSICNRKFRRKDQRNVHEKSHAAP